MNKIVHLDKPSQSPWTGRDCFSDSRCNIEGICLPCPKHKEYQGQLPPKNKCVTCQSFYECIQDYK